MGKTQSFLYGVSGKVGNTVARKGPNGGTVLAQYQPKVKNPQTNAQMAQRIILATVAQAIPLLSPIVDHSFEGFAVGAKSKNEFRRLNMRLLRQYAAYDFANTPSAVDATCFMTTKGIKALIPNRYQISSGSLAQPRLAIARDSSDGNKLIFTFPKLTLPIAEDDIPNVKFADVMRQMFGITSPGEQITVVIIQRSGEGFKYMFNDDDSPGWVIPYTSMRAARLVVPSDTDFNQTIRVDSSDVDSTVEDIMGRVMAVISSSAKTDMSLCDTLNNTISDASNFTSAIVGGNLETTLSAKIEVDSWSADSNHLGHAYAGGIIRSKYNDNGKWSYSNSFMEIAGLSDDEWKNYGLEWNSAIQAWFTTNMIASNDLFLKEGATANELGESFA